MNATLLIRSNFGRSGGFRLTTRSMTCVHWQGDRLVPNSSVLGEELWTFDLEGVRGHEQSFDKDFSAHVMWNRPELYVRFLPAKGQQLGANDHRHVYNSRAD
ncbi:hypothetical protein QBC46DRAFT_341805 [Diplogelasinospora grovesii]|uniref:Uncharacterized protein n=1 Tax=Diplogelasinospora grovesii TaxID=303347 RepID=A0AAN6N6T8_9PEZI|nr:hypothetical protein QBC46DRAFT_341805 [Diplogelasinospora grovesii]